MAEITIDKNLKISTKGLDRILAAMCFAFPDKDEQRDDLIKREIVKYAEPFARSAFEESDFWTRVGGAGGQKKLLERFCKELFKRYVKTGMLLSDKWIEPR